MRRVDWARVATVVGALVVLVVAPAGAAGGVTAGPGEPVPHAGAPPTATTVAGPADDRLLVTVAPGTTDAAVARIATEAGATVEAHTDTTVILDPTGGPTTAAAVARAPDVVAVEPNGRLFGSATPDDPYFADQYGLADAQPGGIRAVSAWNGTTGSRDVVVGVLDSGVALGHPDLRANLWTNRTGIGGCPYGTHGFDAVAGDCTPADDDAHGTHVAGIVGATGDNGRGVTGVAQKVSLMPLRMLYHDPTSARFPNATGTEADAIRAIDWALNAKAHGVNLRVLQASWGTSLFSSALSRAIGRAEAAGVLFVTAAGNGLDNDGVAVDLGAPGNDQFPCEDPHANVVCVGATDRDDTLATFSNWGAGVVDLAAPGVAIASTVPRGRVGGCFDREYCRLDGTSMAAPFVSGAAADVLASEPGLSVDQLRARLVASVDPSPALSGRVASGGRLDLCRAIPACDGIPAVPPSRVQNLRADVGDGTVALRWTAPASNGNALGWGAIEVSAPAGTVSLPPDARSYTVHGLTDDVTTTVRVRAVGSGGPGPWASVPVRPYAGGFVVDGTGALHPVAVGGRAPSAALDGPRWSGDVARGVAILPTGTGGYVVDLYGGLHRFRIGADSPLPAATTGGPYWPGWGIVRGVALSSRGGGVVLDGFGGLHPFGIGDAPRAAGATGGPYWSGFDIARGVTFAADGTGGEVVDGYGGIHPFGRPGAVPARTTGGPYWPGWDIVRGLTLVPGTGGGWVLDGFGGVHPYAAGGPAPPGPSANPYWSGFDFARGIDR